MNKVLITGANGFIGCHCLDFLRKEKDFEIHAVTSKRPDEFHDEVIWHQVDLLDADRITLLMAKVHPSHLLHLAWYTVPGKYWNSNENIKWLEASLLLLRSFSIMGGERVVIAGTCAEYDWKYGYCTEETTPLSPIGLYGICKHSLQLVLDSFCRQTGISSAWGRIFFPYGPDDYANKLVPSVIRALLQSETAKCSSGNQLRDYIYVSDVAEAFVQLLKSDVKGPVNIATGNPIAIKEIVYKIAKKLNRTDLIQLGEVPISSEEPDLLAGNVKRLSNEVGWKPKYDLDQGLDKTISSWKKRFNLEK